MKAAIMQPYFFPYIGYFQLMHAADTFVLLDDVQYINRGWINRNLIFRDGRLNWLTLPVAKANRNLAINQREYLLNRAVVDRLKRQITEAYKTSSRFDEALPVIEGILDFPDPNVAHFNANLLQHVANFLRLEIRVIYSSDLDISSLYRGQRKIIELCKFLNARKYINPHGGMGIYEADLFEKNGLDLYFLETAISPCESTKVPRYPSILHYLMNSSDQHLDNMIRRYKLIGATPPRQVLRH